jgi:hypothetical protein
MKTTIQSHQRPSSWRLLKPLFVGIFLLEGVCAWAVPVRILSHTSVDVEVTKAADSLHVTSRLRDDRRVPIPFKELVLSAGPQATFVTRTSAQGIARWVLGDKDIMRITGSDPGDERRVIKLTVRFAGHHRYGPSTARQTLDLSRDTVRLDVVVVPAEVRPSQTPQVFAILKARGGGLNGVQIALEVAGQKVLGTTGLDGQFAFTLVQTPKPGRYEVRVAFAGNAQFNGVEERRTLTVVLPVMVTVDAVIADDDEPTLNISGHLRTSEGPHSGTLSLAINDRIVGYAAAGADGLFESRLSLTSLSTEIGPSEAIFRVYYNPTEIWEIPAVSTGVRIEIPPLPRAPSTLYVLPFAVLLMLTILVLAIRRGVFLRFWQWIVQYGQPAAMRAGSSRYGERALVVPMNEPDSNPATGRTITQVSGQVCDWLVDRPIEGVTLSVVDPKGRSLATTQSDDGGRFRCEPAAAYRGRANLVVEAPGYHRETIDIALPHRGIWSPCRVHLTPLRALSFHAYQRWVASHGGSRRVGWDTPRQIAAWLQSHGSLPRETLADLVRHYEHVFYGAPTGIGLREHERFASDLADWHLPKDEAKP